MKKKIYLTGVLHAFLIMVFLLFLIFAIGIRPYFEPTHGTYKKYEEKPMRSVEIRLNGRETSYNYLIDRADFEKIEKAHRKIYVYSIDSIYTDDIDAYVAKE